MLSWLLVLVLLAGAGCPAQAQSSAYFQPDSTLTRRAFQLSYHYTRPEWQALAAALWSKPHPIYSYLAYGQSRPVACWRPPSYSFHYRHYYQQVMAGTTASRPRSSKSFRQLDSHLAGLRMERRLADYQQLGALLLARATKVRKIKQALPLLVLKVDSAGRVQNVAVNKQRTHYGLTQRSRKIILKTLRENDFRVREAYDYFDQPRPLHDKLLATRQRVGAAAAATSHFLFDWALYHKVRRVGRCGEVRYVKVPWLGRE